MAPFSRRVTLRAQHRTVTLDKPACEPADPRNIPADGRGHTTLAYRGSC